MKGPKNKTTTHMDRGSELVAHEPDVALLISASGSLARRQAIADISSKYCKTANTSRVALQSYHSCRFRFNILLDRTLAKLVSNQTTFSVSCGTNIQLYGSHERFPAPSIDTIKGDES